MQGAEPTASSVSRDRDTLSVDFPDEEIETILRNVQPLFADLWGGGFAVAHNGNLTNAITLRNELVRDGAIFQSTSDTETILQLVARSRKPRVMERFVDDEGLISEKEQMFFLHEDYPQPLAGKGLVLGCRASDGETIAPTTTIAEVASKVKWVVPVRINGEVTWLPAEFLDMGLLKEDAA